MIKRLLVANRGEIAVRIMATAAVLGIETVQLPGTGAAAYLDVDAVVGMGCDMLHPGYGFLSEQPRLAERCAEGGVRFVGPAPGALALFGDKTARGLGRASIGASFVKSAVPQMVRLWIIAQAGESTPFGMITVGEPAPWQSSVTRCQHES